MTPLRVLFVGPVPLRDTHRVALDRALGSVQWAPTVASPANVLHLLAVAESREWDIVVLHSCPARSAAALARHVPDSARWLTPVWDEERTPRGERHPVLTGYRAA